MKIFDKFDYDNALDEEEFKDICVELQDGLVPAINKWHEQNEMHLVIVEGFTGVGKSLYALLIASQIYNTKNWHKLKPYFVYERDDFLNTIKSKRRINGLYVRKPLLVWDDAGNWLNYQDYNTKEVKDVCKYLTVAREHWSCVMLTAPDAEDIVKRIRNVKNRILIQVIKNSSKKDPYRRMARFFVRWKSPDKTKKGEDTQIYENFWLSQCDKSLYDEYRLFRVEMVAKAVSNM
jgi:hypothetical protein